MNNNSKIDDTAVIELIKSMALYPKALNTMIETFAKQAAIFGKNKEPQQSQDELRSLFTSHDFLKPFTEKFKEIFTEEEISYLIGVCHSNITKKLFEHSNHLLNPLYSEMRKQVGID